MAYFYIYCEAVALTIYVFLNVDHLWEKLLKLLKDELWEKH